MHYLAEVTTIHNGCKRVLSVQSLYTGELLIEVAEQSESTDDIYAARIILSRQELLNFLAGLLEEMAR